MSLLIVLLGIILLIVLILKKVNAMLALLMASIFTGLWLGMPVQKVVDSINLGVGSTLGSTAMVIALGAMIGKLAEESGAAQKLVLVLVKWFGRKHIQWAILCTGILAGIPLFYNAGFVVLIPLVFAIASTTKLPLLYVGMPMAAALSVTHGFLPPHPGPVALAGIFGAQIGQTLIYGLIISIPITVIAGIIFPRLILKTKITPSKPVLFEIKEEKELPSALKSFLMVLIPVLFIAIGTIGVRFSHAAMSLSVFNFFQDPTFALLASLVIIFFLLKIPLYKTMEACADGVKSIAMILLIIAAGGAFKQVLLDSNIGAQIKMYVDPLHLSPLFLGWLIAAVFRIALGSATVAALTASGMVAPFLNNASPALMVLSVGAGSLMFSHVNDTGFWMFKEYFGLSLKQTFLTWTIMESLISVLGLLGVLLLQAYL